MTARLRPLRAAALLIAAAAAVLVSPAGLASAAPSSTTAPSSSSTAPSKGEVTFAVEPSNSQGPDHRATFEYHAIKPGTTIQDFVSISNFSAVPFKFSVSAEDAKVGADGQVSFPTNGTKSKDIGTWITLEKPSYTIPAHARLTTRFTIKVPDNATPGDHTAGIIGTATVASTNAGNKVSVDHRIALPLYLDVPGKIAAGLRIQGLSSDYGNSLNPFGGGDVKVSYKVTNTGNINVSGTQDIQITGPFGMNLGEVKAPPLPLLLPGQSTTVSATVPGVFPLGWMTTKVTIKPTHSVPAPGAISPSATGNMVAFDPVNYNTGFWATPILLLIIIVVLALAIWWTVKYRRFRRMHRNNELFDVAELARQQAAADEMATVGGEAEAGETPRDTA